MMKKIYLNTAIIGMIAFIISFMLVYAYIYENSSQKVSSSNVAVEAGLTQEESVENNGQAIEEAIILEEERIYVLPTTNVTLSLVDANAQTIEEKKLSTTPFLGMTEEDIKTYFKGYTVEVFSEKEVVLSKVFEITTSMPSYYLRIQEGVIGVIEVSDTTTFMSLHLPEDRLSRVDAQRLQGEGILITKKQVQELAKDPYHIEYILQGYTE